MKTRLGYEPLRLVLRVIAAMMMMAITAAMTAPTTVPMPAHNHALSHHAVIPAFASKSRASG